MIGHKLKNRYELLETLAQGANSATYKARDTVLNRDVSVKVLPDLDESARQRLFQQAKAAAQLSHPNIAAVYDFDADDDGSTFVVTEYVEGKPLSDLAPAPPDFVIRLGKRISDALAYARIRGVTHTNLNPLDIRVTPSGEPKIVDLGLQVPSITSNVTATGTVIGSPAYLAPEQVKGEPTDARSDIYSLGAILYELASGQPPFQGSTPMAVLMQHVTQPPPPLHTVAPDVPADLEAVILTMLEKDPARRYQSSADLASALGGVAADTRHTSSPGLSSRTGQWRPLPELLDEAGKQKKDILTPAPPPAPAAPAPEPLQPAPPQAAPRPAAPRMEEELKPGAPPAPAQPIPAGPPVGLGKPAQEPAPAELPEAAEPVLRQRESASAQPQPVQFSAYFPKEVKPDEWQPLHAYVFRQSAEKSVSEDAGKQLGERVSVFRKLVQSAKQIIQEGELITATPTLPGFQFNPPTVSVAFFEDWHRFDFKLRAHTAPLNHSANGLLTFTVAGVIVADIPLSIYVGESASAGEQTSSGAKPYQAIFCSYSHRDTQIVERVERAYKALGLDYLRDVVSLKSGTHWSAELLQLIEKADIFQLFWSEAAAQSEYVQQEWQYALKLNRDQAHFIRPVYWRQPMPTPPPDMSHIHFAYQPDLEK